MSENTQLKISIENLGKGKPAAKLTQEFNSLILDKDVSLSHAQQKVKLLERRDHLNQEEIKKLTSKCNRLLKVKENLIKLVRIVMAQVNPKLKAHVFELLDQIEAHNQVNETITCVLECTEELKVVEIHDTRWIC